MPNWYRTIKRILEYQTSKQNFEYLGKLWEPVNHTTKVLDDVSCVSIKKLAIALHRDDNMLNKRLQVII